MPDTYGRMEKFQPLTLSTPSNHLSCGHHTVKVLNLTYISIPIMEPLCKVCNNKGLSFIFLIWCADLPGKWALELRYNSAWRFFRIMAARYMRGETLQNDYWLCFAYTALPVCFVSIRKYLFKVPRQVALQIVFAPFSSWESLDNVFPHYIGTLTWKLFAVHHLLSIWLRHS